LRWHDARQYKKIHIVFATHLIRDVKPGSVTLDKRITLMVGPANGAKRGAEAIDAIKSYAHADQGMGIEAGCESYQKFSATEKKTS
jgi:hypothetical protein